MLCAMVQGQDVVVLLKLALQPDDPTIRRLSAELGLPHAAVQRSLGRLKEAGLYDPARRRVSLARADEFLVHAVKYLFPAEFHGEGRGIATAWAAEPLRNELAPPTGLPPVWPDPHGNERGLVLEPIHPSVPEVARRDPDLGALIGLVDAIRAGDPRVAGLAADMLTRRLGNTSSPE